MGEQWKETASRVIAKTAIEKALLCWETSTADIPFCRGIWYCQDVFTIMGKLSILLLFSVLWEKAEIKWNPRPAEVTKKQSSL